MATNLFLNFQGSSFNSFFRYFADKILSIFFQRATTQERSIIMIRRKIGVSYVFMKNPNMKFQNPSMHRSKFMLCI